MISEPAVSLETRGERRRLVLVLLAPLFMALVAVSVINVALPAIGDAFSGGAGSNTSALQWVLSGYALAFGILLVPAGRIGDATGRRRMLLIGVTLFTIGSLLAGFSASLGMLNGARVLQGIGSGLLNPQVVGIIQLFFRGQSRARAFAMFGTTVAVATAVGPVIGGLLIQLFGEGAGWRVMFLINVPIGVFVLIMGRWWIPNDRRARGSAGRPGLDPVGIVLLALAILAIMLPFLERGGTHLVWLGVPVGIALLIVWVAWENRTKGHGRAPMVDMAIFSSAAFRNGIGIVSVYFLGSTSIWIVVPLYLQLHLHHSAFEAALLGVPSSAAAAISSQVSGRYVLRLGRRLVSAGFVVVLLGLLGTVLLARPIETGAVPYWLLAAPLTLVGLSQGMTISPNQTLTLHAVDPRYGGVAGGILQLGQRMGAAVGTALIPGILFSLTENGTPWLDAFTIAAVVIMVMAVLALGVSFHDRAREKAERST